MQYTNEEKGRLKIISCMKDGEARSGELVPQFSLGRVSLKDHDQLLPCTVLYIALKLGDGLRCDHVRRASFMCLLVAHAPRLD